MKITKLAVALIAYSGSGKMAEASADVIGYTGSEYTYFGLGYCADNEAYYNHAQQADLDTVDQCAQHCQSFPSVKGQVGFDYLRGAKTCFCQYTNGTGPESYSNENGITYNTGVIGPVT